MLDGFIEKANIPLNGGEYVQACIHWDKPDVLKYFIEKGVDLAAPPMTVSPMNNDLECHEKYRKSPFVVQAACKGSLEVFKMLLQYGQGKCAITDAGHIGFSKKRRNTLASNVIAAAAYAGNLDIINFSLSKLNKS